MRALVFVLPAVTLMACGDGRPVEGESCAAPEELRCGHLTRDYETAPVFCPANGTTWASFFPPAPNPCAAECADATMNTVTCGGVTYGHQNTRCEDSTAACDLATDTPMFCTNGAWLLAEPCGSGARCGVDEGGKAAICK